MIERSFLNEEYKQKYAEVLTDRLKVIPWKFCLDQMHYYG